MDWKPIETAPQDARWILIRDKWGRQGRASFGPGDFAFNIMAIGTGHFGPWVESRALSRRE